jgi:hypothetical protein
LCVGSHATRVCSMRHVLRHVGDHATRVLRNPSPRVLFGLGDTATSVMTCDTWDAMQHVGDHSKSCTQLSYCNCPLVSIHPSQLSSCNCPLASKLDTDGTDECCVTRFRCKTELFLTLASIYLDKLRTMWYSTEKTAPTYHAVVNHWWAGGSGAWAQCAYAHVNSRMHALTRAQIHEGKVFQLLSVQNDVISSLALLVRSLRVQTSETWRSSSERSIRH